MLCVDIGTNSIKVCDLVDDGLGWQVELLVHETMPPGLFHNDAVVDSRALIKLLSAVVADNNLNRRAVAIAVSSASGVVRPMSVPMMTDEELSEQLPWEAEMVVPYSIGDVYLARTTPHQSSDGAQLEFQLAAERRDVIDPVVDVVRSAGLRPVHVGVSTLAVADWFQRQHRKLHNALVVDVGASRSELIAIRDRCVSAVLLGDLAGEHLTRALQERLQGTRDDAERVKLAAYYEEPEQEAGPYRGSNTNAIVRVTIDTAAKELAEDVAERVAGAIADGSFQPGTVWLTGGSAAIPQLAESMRDRLGIRVEQWLPYSGLRTRRGADALGLLQVGPLMAVTFGLALRSHGLGIDSLSHTRWWQFWKR